MKEAMAKLPMLPGIAAYAGMILAMIFCVLAGWEFYRRKKGVMATGIWGWMIHEIPEFVMITLLLAGFAPLTKLVSQVFFMGLALVGPMVMLGSVLYLYFDRDFERTASWMSVIVVLFFSSTAFFYFTPGLPLVARSVLIYMPVFSFCALPAFLLWRKRKPKIMKMSYGFLGLGIGHELLEAVVLHPLLLGFALGVFDPIKPFTVVLLAFAVMQFCGPVIWWFFARRRS